MAAPLQPFPQATYLQQGNLTVLLTWPPSVGATEYAVQRSIDGVTYATVDTVAALEYEDTDVTQNTQYWYRVAARNGSAEQSAYTTPTPSSIVPCVSGTSSLLEIRRNALERADRVGTQFVTVPEVNRFINFACDELYDLVTASYEDYGVAQPVYFTTNGSSMSYPLPDGVTTFQNADGDDVVPPPIYKLAGIDLGLQNAPNGFVTVQRYNFIDRNRYVFPNTASTIYGVFGLQYRFIGNAIRFIPQPSSSQPIGIWYVPRRVQLLRDTDTTDGFNGWNQYCVIRAAKYVLDKEESDTTKLDEELSYLKSRIEAMAPNRDEGQADTISDARNASGFGSDGGFGFGGPGGMGT